MRTWSLIDIQKAADKLQSFRGKNFDDETIFNQYRTDHGLSKNGDAFFLVKALANEKGS